MAGFFDSIAKGFSSIMPQDDPDVKIFNAQTAIKEQRDKETAVYAQIGRKAFEQYGAEAYPEENARLEGINVEIAVQQRILDAANAEKANRERAAAEAALVASQVNCPACGAVNPKETRFCQDCGAKLPEAEPQKRFCTNCGAELVGGARFCGSCGFKNGD